MQIRAGFKKEWLQFTRTFRLGGVLLSVLGFAVAEPLMLWGVNALLSLEMSASVEAAGTAGMDMGSLLGLPGLSMAEMYFSTNMAEFCTTSMLIIMLVLMSPCGGEQKKRATIIPSCTGLGYYEYLVPKFVIYPVTVFLTGFAGCCVSGALNNAINDGESVSTGFILLGAFMCAVYMSFIFVVYMAVGICTSRPGVVTAAMYVGVSLVQMILTGLNLTDYQPLTLRSLVSGRMFMQDFVLGDNIANIVVATVLSVVIGVMMFILTLTVLKAKKINNQEDKPEF